MGRIHKLNLIGPNIPILLKTVNYLRAIHLAVRNQILCGQINGVCLTVSKFDGGLLRLHKQMRLLSTG